MLIIITILVTLVCTVIGILRQLIPKKVGYFIVLVMVATGIAYFSSLQEKNRDSSDKSQQTIFQQIKDKGNDLLDKIGVIKKEPLPQKEKWACTKCQKRWEKMKSYYIDKVLYTLVSLFVCVVVYQTGKYSIEKVGINFYKSFLDQYKESTIQKDTEMVKSIRHMLGLLENQFNENTNLLSRIFWGYLLLPKTTYHYVKSKI